MLNESYSTSQKPKEKPHTGLNLKLTNSKLQLYKTQQ